jgi:hypothetical protein
LRGEPLTTPTPAAAAPAIGPSPIAVLVTATLRHHGKLRGTETLLALSVQEARAQVVSKFGFAGDDKLAYTVFMEGHDYLREPTLAELVSWLSRNLVSPEDLEGPAGMSLLHKLKLMRPKFENWVEFVTAVKRQAGIAYWNF